MISFGGLCLYVTLCCEKIKTTLTRHSAFSFVHFHGGQEKIDETEFVAEGSDDRGHRCTPRCWMTCRQCRGASHHLAWRMVKGDRWKWFVALFSYFHQSCWMTTVNSQKTNYCFSEYIWITCRPKVTLYTPDAFHENGIVRGQQGQIDPPRATR